MLLHVFISTCYVCFHYILVYRYVAYATRKKRKETKRPEHRCAWIIRCTMLLNYYYYLSSFVRFDLNCFHKEQTGVQKAQFRRNQRPQFHNVGTATDYVQYLEDETKKQNKKLARKMFSEKKNIIKFGMFNLLFPGFQNLTP